MKANSNQESKAERAELLCRYAEGRLDGEARAKAEALLREDPASRRAVCSW